MFAFEHTGIVPDILVAAKGMGGGLPVAAVWTSGENALPPGKHGSTFGGNPLVCAAALAAINFMIKNRLAEQAADKGDYFIRQLQRLESAKIREIRGLGLMIGIELKEKVRPYINLLAEKGVIAVPAGSTTLRLLPPLVIDYPQLDTVKERIGEVLAVNQPHT
jgi:acetylornithine/LysW-gamma-L-lysine aminotransferase